MKTIIIYTTTHGCTEKAVKELSQKLSGEITTIDIRNHPSPPLTEFDRIIIGGSIHAGQIQKRIKNFCTSNIEMLNNKEIGLFICCMYEPEIAREQIKNAFPEELHQMAKTEAIFGGEFNFDKMNFIEKMLVKKIAGVRESVSNLDHNSIERFANRMDKTYNPFMFLV
ncbi:MAG TPA: flavodoxin domain-containing protein [Prolixibacteraceae bacterium]|nr:flavodoxin domain-containing protein [Prolixibacteraceae bacterium]